MLFPFVPFSGLILDDLDDEQMKKLIKIDTSSGNPACGICLKEYRSRRATFDHLRAAHTEKSIHKCFYCSKAFKTKHIRSMHMCRKHGEVHRANQLLKKAVRPCFVKWSCCGGLFLLRFKLFGSIVVGLGVHLLFYEV